MTNLLHRNLTTRNIVRSKNWIHTVDRLLSTSLYTITSMIVDHCPFYPFTAGRFLNAIFCREDEYNNSTCEYLNANMPAYKHNHFYSKLDPARAGANKLQNIYCVIKAAWGMSSRSDREASAVFFTCLFFTILQVCVIILHICIYLSSEMFYLKLIFLVRIKTLHMYAQIIQCQFFRLL